MSGEPSAFPWLSVCPSDGEPLIWDLSVSRKEWRCAVCGSFYAFLMVPSVVGTVALNARYDELRAAEASR